MISDLTIVISRHTRQMLRGARKRRRRRWPTLIMALVLIFIPTNQLITLASEQQQQQQPSQLFLPAATQRGPISLVPRVNQKRLEEEVDGFIMQAQQNNSQQAAIINKNSTKITEQAALETTTTTAAAITINPEVASTEDDQYRIPIDVNRQQFVTHDQLTNASSSNDDSLTVGGESNIHRTSDRLDSAAPDEGPKSDHRGQQQHWLRSASKVSHVSSLLSDLFNYFTRPETSSSGLAGNDVFHSYRGTPVETSAPLPINASGEYVADPANSSPLSDNLQQAQDETSLSNQAAHLSSLASVSPTNGTILQQQQHQATQAAAADALGDDNNGRQSGGAGVDTNINGGSIYFLSSGNGTATAAAADSDAGRRFMDEPTATTSSTTTTTTSAPKQVAQSAIDDRQQQTATKRVAGQLSQVSDQSLSDTDGSDSRQHQQQEQVKCSGYCTIPLFTMLCESTYESQDCSESGQKCCVTIDKSTESTESDQQQQQQQTTATNAPDYTDQLQQSQFIEQASRPQSASQVCRGACLPMYHSSLCLKPNEIQLDSPGCLPSFVCCSSPANSDENQLDSAAALETVAASPSDHMISHTSYQQPPQEQSQVSADGSLTAALVPQPPPMSSSSSASDHQEQQQQQQPDQQQMLRQPFYSIRPTARPLGQQATTKSTSSTSPSSSSSPAASFMSQLYQMFKSTTSSTSSNNSRDKQQLHQSPPLRQQRQPPMAPPVQTPVGQASFLSHLFADPYQALGYGLSSRPSSPAPPNMIQQQAINNYAPFPMEPAAHLQQQQQQHQSGAHLLPANNNKNRFPFLAVHQANVHSMNHPNGYQQQQQQQQQQQLSKPFKGNQQQMMLPVNENNQLVVSQQSPSDQEQLLYMQHQMYLQQQQFNKHNGLSFAPNQQQQRFHYPVVPPADNAQPATFVPANQKPPQATNPAVTTTKNTSQMKVVQQQQAVTHHPSYLMATSVAAPILTINKQQQQQVDRPEQTVPVPYSAARPVSGSAGGSGRQQVKIPQRQPLEQKGFVGLPARQQQQDQVLDSQHQRTTPVRQQQQQQIFKLANNELPLLPYASNQQPTRSVAANANNMIQPNRVATTTTDPSRTIVTTNNASQKIGGQKMAVPSSGNDEPILQPISSQQPNAMSSSSSSVNVHFSNNPNHHQAVGDLQQVDPLQQQTRRPSVRPPIHRGKPSATNMNQRPAHDDNSDGDLTVPIDSDVVECPGVCVPALRASQYCARKSMDESFACATPGSICCARLDLAELEIKRTQPSTPVAVVEAVLDSNKLDFPATTQVDSGDESIQIDPSQTDSASKLSTETTRDENNNNQNLPQNGSHQTKSKVQTCGLPNSAGGGGRRTSGQATGRVMGGSDAKPGHWCWQAALMNSKNEYLCGGALIGAKWVLTAAHCITQHIRNDSQLFVRLGQHNLNSSSSGKGAKSIQVKTSYVHHNHNGVTLDNDVALLRLDESVDLDTVDGSDENAICLVCLPERGSSQSALEAGKRCTVTGYGFENEQGPAALRVRQTELPIVGDQECSNKTSAVLRKPFSLPANSFCAGGEQGQDACHGDGGSPLSCLVDGYYELTGIVSWGYKCGSKDLPGLYSKVSTFVGWINQIVSVNN